MAFWGLIFGAFGTTVLYGLLNSVPSLISQFSVIDQNRDYLQSNILERDNEAMSHQIYDFIIVGSGTSGALIANRLSKDYKVLVLEAGGQPNPLMNVPGVGLLLINKPEVDWMYKTVPQKKACLSLRNRQSIWPRGKMEGGSSNINAMIYLRGHHMDYDNWARITGNPIWSYNSVAKFFKKFENFVDDTNPNKGHKGELTIEELSQSLGGLAEYFVHAGEQAGYNKTDLNGIYSEGFDTFKFTQKRGKRWEGYSAFLQPAKDSADHDLTVHKYATATKVLLDKDNRAYGVEYSRHGRTRIARSSKEIILSAGSINSPKILLQSGIGPKKHLESVGISTRQDLPGVGKNLQDHVGTYVGVFTIEQPLTFKVERDVSPSTFLEYLTQGTGPLSSTGVYSVGCISSKYEVENAKRENRTLWPDVQLSFIGHSIPQNFSLIANEENIKYEILETLWGPHRNHDSFHIFMFPTRPVGRGEILLANKNPETPPIIDPKYFEDERDMKVAVEGMRMAVEIVENSKHFQSIGGKLSPIPLAPCANKSFRSDAYWECYLRHLTLTLYHPSGTCAMGSRDDPYSVVDSELKVHGVKNLRVVDASIAPNIISSNINAACNVIAEVAAHLIKSTWSK